MPRATRNEPYCVVVNGDVMDHRHHGTTTQISANLSDQAKIALKLLEPIKDKCQGRLYMIRGTESHSGPAGEAEEELAKDLEAIQDETKAYSRYELYIEIGSALCHFNHTIGVTGSAHYETSALMSEYANSCVDAARWGLRPPDVVVRSHRHRHTEVKVPTKHGYGIIFVTAGWQFKTPFTHRVAGGRVTQPHIGGSLIRQGDEEFFTRHKTWHMKRPKTEKP